MDFPLHAWLKALSALVCMGSAVVLWTIGARAFPKRWFAVFLAMIALNQSMEAVRAVSTDLGVKLLAYRVASVAAALDPAILLVAVLRVACEPWSRRHRLLLAATGIATLLVSLAGATLPGLVDEYYVPPGWRGPVFPIALAAFTSSAYGAAILLASRRDDKDPSRPWLLGALLIALLPRGADTFWAVWSHLWPADYHGPDTLALSAVGLGILVLILWRPLLASRDRVVLAGFACAVLVLAYQMTPTLVESFAPSMWTEGLPSLGRGGASVRWFAFSTFLCAYLIRAEGPAAPLGRRRLAARVLVALSALVLVGVFLVFAEAVAGYHPTLDATDVVLLAAVLLLSQGFRSLIDGVASMLYGVPRAGDMASRLATYRTAAERSILLGRAPDEDGELRALRKELDVDPAAAKAIQDQAELAAIRRLKAGLIVAGRYRVREFLGAGGEGRTFLAHDGLLGRDVVIKEIRTAEGEDASRAVTEARLAGAVHHPNVVTVYDVLVRPDVVFLVMEHVAGGTLDKAIPVETPLAVRADLMTGILRGMAAVHARGIVHRDLKAGNVLVDAQMRPKVTDFGIASLRASTTAGFGPGTVLAGTRHAAAPEQLLGKPVRPSADVYSLGLLARALLVEPPAPLAEVIAKALEEEPVRRWEDAATMLDAWEAALLTARTEGRIDPPR